METLSDRIAKTNELYAQLKAVIRDWPDELEYLAALRLLWDDIDRKCCRATTTSETIDRFIQAMQIEEDLAQERQRRGQQTGDAERTRIFEDEAQRAQGSDPLRSRR